MPQAHVADASTILLADLPSEPAPARPDEPAAADAAGLEQAFSQHLDAIYNYCFRRTSSWSAAEDLAATVFLEAWRSRSRARYVDGTLLPWLYGIASNVCRHHQRSFVRRFRAELRARTPPAVLPATDDLVDDIATSDWLARALESLPDRDQDAFILVCWQDLTYQQAATALSVPVGTIRSRVHRVRRHLRQILTDTRTSPTPDPTTKENLR